MHKLAIALSRHAIWARYFRISHFAKYETEDSKVCHPQKIVEYLFGLCSEFELAVRHQQLLAARMHTSHTVVDRTLDAADI